MWGHTECICHSAKVQRVSEGQFSFKAVTQAGTHRYRHILFLSFKHSVHAKLEAHPCLSSIIIRKLKGSSDVSYCNSGYISLAKKFAKSIFVCNHRDTSNTNQRIQLQTLHRRGAIQNTQNRFWLVIKLHAREQKLNNLSSKEAWGGSLMKNLSIISC